MDNRSVPPSTVVPELGYEDVGAAVAWLRGTLGFAGHVWTFSEHRRRRA